jgi:hypothetical protein
MPHVSAKTLNAPYFGYYMIPTTFVVGPVGIVARSTEDKINSFANLRDGWDYGAGGPIPKHTRDLAIAWNQVLRSQGLMDTDAFPGADGEIVVATGIGEHYLELIVEPDDSISVGYDFRGKQTAYRPNMQSMEAVQYILDLAGKICVSLGYYTLTNTTKNKASLLGQHFGTQRMTDAYLSWEQNALMPAEDPFAPTSGNFINIPESWENLPFFGSSSPIYYQRRTA